MPIQWPVHEAGRGSCGILGFCHHKVKEAIIIVDLLWISTGNIVKTNLMVLNAMAP